MNPTTLTSLLYVACLVLMVLFCIFVKVKIWIRVIGSVMMLAITIFIVVKLGHSEWNRLSQLEANINKLETNTITLNDVSSKAILNDVKNMQKPLKITIKESEPEQQRVFGVANWNRVEINGKEYNIKDICYTGPLNWTPFQSWTIVEVH
ncbi:hypothetical protein YDYSY3_38160 [Paenibacillus chitinolyticus]|uniref:hypothetical protein n=1 Tax=Paenibacillus chitinolyticus TaxID=79263 RepID=UPI0026E4A4FC|nr:hypothetical protein [Paenibacillus chitinolyticus]GKS12816.1 hypothetical protein YDYSY3_38160 [Paenibacillus chitinolyticus]